MKKTFYILVVMLFVSVGFIVGDLFGNIDRNIPLTRGQLANLTSINLADYNVTDYGDAEIAKRCLTKKVCKFMAERNDTECESVINTCSKYMNASLLNEWEEIRITQIADATIKRQSKKAKVITNKGKTIITQR